MFHLSTHRNITFTYTRTVSLPYVPSRTAALVALTYVRIASLVALLATVAGTSVAPGRGHRGTRCTYARTHAGRGHFGRARSRAHARTCATRACSLCGSINCARAFARTHGRAISQLRTYVREFAWAMSDPADFSQSCNRIGPVHEGEYTDDATEVEGPPNLIWHNHEVGTQVSPEDFGNDVGAPPVSCTTALGDDTGVEAVGVLSEGPSNDVVTAVGPKGIDNDVNGQHAHVCQMQDGKAGAEAILNGQMQERFLCFTGVQRYVRTAFLFHLRAYVRTVSLPCALGRSEAGPCSFNVRTYAHTFVRTSVSGTYVRTYVRIFLKLFDGEHVSTAFSLTAS